MLLYLISVPGLERWHGLYSLDDGATVPQRISNIDYGCGLHAAVWDGKIALGCSGGDGSPLQICNVTSGDCDNITPDLVDRILALTVPKGAGLNALKVAPVHWSQDGQLYITATPHAVSQSWSGRGHLLLLDPATKDLQPILRNADLISFREGDG